MRLLSLVILVLLALPRASFAASEGAPQSVPAFEPVGINQTFMPYGELTAGRDGFLYSTAFLDRSLDPAQGIHRTSPDGRRSRLLHTFRAQDGFLPISLIAGDDGFLYGTTLGSGAPVQGTIFRLDPQTGAFKKLHDFSHRSNSSGHPSLQFAAPDGWLYGIGATGGQFGWGYAFRCRFNGDYELLYDFGGDPAPAIPRFPTCLRWGGDGNLYGTCDSVGIFRLTPEGECTTVWAIPPGHYPPVDLARGKDGAFYFVLTDGVMGNLPRQPRIMRLGPDGAVTTVLTLPHSAQGYLTPARIFPGRDSELYLLAPVALPFTPEKPLHLVRLTLAGALEPVGALPAGQQWGAFAQTSDGGFLIEGHRYLKPSQLFRLAPAAGQKLNLPPTARDDHFPLDDAEMILEVLENDGDKDGDSLRIISISEPAQGSATIGPDGKTIHYLPAAADGLFHDELIYTIADSRGGTATGHVVVRTPLRGTFATLLSVGETDAFLRVNVSAGGALSGKLSLRGWSGVLRGTLDSEHAYRFEANHWASETEKITLELALRGQGRQLHLEGTLTLGEESARFAVHPSIFPSGVPEAGRYTVLLPDDASRISPVQGTGIAIMNVSASGAVRVAGHLPDGTSFSTGSYLWKNHTLPFYAELRRRPRPNYFRLGGHLSGTLLFEDRPGESDCAGALRWAHLRHAGDGVATRLISKRQPLLGSRFIPAGDEGFVLEVADRAARASVALQGGGLQTTVEGTVALSPSWIASDAGDLQLRARFTSANGYFTGNFLHPRTEVMAAFKGVAFQKQNIAAGFFRSSLGSGAVKFAQPPARPSQAQSAD